MLDIPRFILIAEKHWDTLKERLIGGCEQLAVLKPQIAEVFEKALKAFVQKHRPQKVIKRNSPEKLNPNSRYISRSVRNEVANRDDGQCTFVSPEGTRCSERCGLHLDHIQPFANGGPSTVENLRLLCPAHNQFHAEICFGKEFMRQKRNEKISDAFSERTSR